MRFGGWPGWVCLGLTLQGCGKTDANQPAPNDPGGAGSSQGQSSEPRLVPWQLETAGAEPLVVGIFDTELERHCRFLPHASGELRCLPLTVGGLELTSAYADPQCEQRIYRINVAAADAVRAAGLEGLALPLEPSDCEQRYVVATVSELAEDAPHYVMFGGDTCGLNMAGPPPYLAGQVVDFARGPLLDHENYVSGELTRGELLDERLRLHEIDADGSRFQHSLSDDHWQKPCTLNEMRGSLACMPESIDDNSNFHVDMACEGDNVWYAAACTDPAFIGQYDDLYALGQPFTGPVWEFGKGCRETSITADGSVRFYSRGELLGDDALAAAEWFQAGTGLLQLRGLRGAGDELLVLSDSLFGDASSLRERPNAYGGPRYHNSETGLDCTPIWTTEGEVRCVPSTAQVEPFSYKTYVDPECSKPAYLCLSQEPCVGTDVVVMGYDENGEYRAISRNAAVAVTGESVYGITNEECVASPLGGSPLFETGEELAWDDYPLLVETNGRSSSEP